MRSRPGRKSTISVTAFGMPTVEHGMLLELGSGHVFKVIHPWWRRLGHWVFPKWVKLHPETVLTVKELPSSKRATEMVQALLKEKVS